MSDRHATVVITSDETLSGVIDQIRAAADGGRVVHLVVPIDSSLLLTASEFRALKDAIDEQRLPVVVRTSDPLRLRLGERLGLRTQAAARPKPAVAAVAAPTMPSPLAPEPTPPATAPGVAAEPAALPAMPRLDPHDLWPGQNGADAESGTGDPAEPLDSAEPRAGDSPGNPPRRWLPMVIFLVLLVLGAALAIRYVVPRAVIQVTPRVEPIVASLVFDVSGEGQPLDDVAAFALAPDTRQVEVVWEGAAPTTGILTVPDGTATGPIELRNASSEALTVEGGTLIATEAGAEFAFTDAVTVPASDPATGEPGAATGSVRAVEPGTGGNIETGELGGRLPNGVYYSNRMEPTTGGTDKEFPMVAQADLDALSAQAAAAADDLAAAALEDDGVAVSALTVAEQRDVFDHQADEEAEMVSLRAEMTLDVAVYDVGEAESRYESALTQQLAAAAPDGYWVNPEAIAFSEPVAVEAPDGGTRLEVTASVDAEARLGEAERQDLAERLAGLSAAEAEAVLSEIEGIATYTVEYQPAWLPQQMPANAGRIAFEIVE